MKGIKHWKKRYVDIVLNIAAINNVPFEALELYFFMFIMWRICGL